MFRRFADRIGSLVYGESTDDSGMTALQAMGFDADQARGALQATDGDLDRAAELLLAGADVAKQHQLPLLTPEANQLDQCDAALQCALQESMKTEDNRLLRMAEDESILKLPSAPPQRNAAINRAAEAAEDSAAVRAKMTKEEVWRYRAKLQDKVKEEEVYRLCDQLKSHPAAVDTLYRTITAVQRDPTNDKYRKIATASTGYRRNVESAPGAAAFLRAMKFVPTEEGVLTLDISDVDSDVLQFGISVLDEVKNSFEYQQHKRRIQAKSAFSKFENALLNHHPEVKVPAKLQDKSKEEQIIRCGDRLKSYPAAVDTLYRALTAVQRDPDNSKFRAIDKTTLGYQRSVEGAPGAESLLRAMNFYPKGPNTLVLERSQVDPALLFLGVSALEQAKDSSEYKDRKRKLRFAKEVEEIRLSGDSSQAEAIRRADFMSKCPTEPDEGRGALLQVVIADDSVRRRFDGDDVVRDVLNWLGGHGSIIPEKILSREWCLVDLNRYPLVPIDCEKSLGKTLQHVGCWPSGRLEIQPSGDEWRLNGSVGNLKQGSTRGLGAMDLSF